MTPDHSKTSFPRLPEAAQKGEEIVIARSGHPVARLVALAEVAEHRSAGLLKGKIEVAQDFDAPLAADVLSAFEDGAVEPAGGRRR